MMLSLEERPRKFSDMVGNTRKIQEFQEMAKTGEFPNIMFFVGDSGSGKTTSAFIIASLLTGKNPIVNPDGTVDPNPEDGSYKAIVAENWGAHDVYFFVADKMGPADIEAVNTICSAGSLFGGAKAKKVIIIDEAQNLKKNAKGLTLTFLEQGKFTGTGVHIILCTMEPEAFDKATLDRGQVFTFKSPSATEIGNYLLSLLDKLDPEEKVPEIFSSEGLTAILDNCGGSVRKAVQDLQRCLSGKYFSKEEIRAEMDLITADDLGKDLSALMDRKKEALVNIAGYLKEEVFNMMYGALADAYFFRATGKAREAWRQGSSKAMSTHPALPELLATFDEVFRSRGPYFRPDVLLYRLSRFVLDSPAGLTQATPSPPPPQGGLPPRRRG